MNLKRFFPFFLFLFFSFFLFAGCGGGDSTSLLPSGGEEMWQETVRRLRPKYDPVRLQVGQSQTFEVTPVVDGGYSWFVSYGSGAQEFLGNTPEILWTPEIAGNFKISCNIVVFDVVVEDPIVEPPVVIEDPIVEPPVVIEDPIVEPPVVVEDPIVEPPVVVEDPIVEPPVVVSSWTSPEGNLQGTRTSNFPGPALGTESWRISLDSFKLSGVVVDLEGNIFVNTLTSICKINPEGTLWTFSPAGFTKFSCPFYNDGKIYTGAVATNFEINVFAIDVNTGMQLWKSANIMKLKSEHSEEIFVGSPAVVKNNIYIYCFDMNSLTGSGGLTKLDLNGNIDPLSGGNIGFNMGSNSIYFSSSTNTLVRTFYQPADNSNFSHIETMDLNFSRYLEPGIKTNPNGYCLPPIVANNSIICASDSTLVRIADKIPEPMQPYSFVWKVSVPVGQFIVRGDTIIVFEKGRGLIGRNLSDGEEIPELSNSGLSSALSMALDKDGFLYLVSYDEVVRLNRDLEVQWALPTPIDQTSAATKFASITLANGVAYATGPWGLVAIK